MRKEMSYIKIASSFLSADFGYLQKEVERVEQAGVDLIHLDVMDGHFVPNLTFGPTVVEAFDRLTELPLDVHLMIEDPDRYLDVFATSGADYLTVHVEACDRLAEIVSHIKHLGKKVGVALNPATPLTEVEEILPELDVVLVMSVSPGFGGQKFIPSVLEKVKGLRDRLFREGYSVLISVDGGIDLHTASLAVEAGAEVLVVGSALFRAPDMVDMVHKLKNCLKQL